MSLAVLLVALLILQPVAPQAFIFVTDYSIPTGTARAGHREHESGQLDLSLHSWLINALSDHFARVVVEDSPNGMDQLLPPNLLPAPKCFLDCAGSLRCLLPISSPPRTYFPSEALRSGVCGNETDRRHPSLSERARSGRWTGSFTEIRVH